MTDQTTMNRLQRLIAMANDSSSPREAEIAARRVQKLLEKHNLTEMDIKYSALHEEETSSVYANTETYPEYFMLLVSVVSSVFDCKSLFCPVGSTTNIAFIGVKADVICAKYAMEVLSRQLKHDRKDLIAQLPKRMSKAEKTALANSFAESWVKAVWTKVAALRSFDTQKRDIVESYFEKKYGNLNRLKTRNLAPINPKFAKTHQLVQQKGLAAGERAQLHRGVDVSAQANYLEELA